MLRMFPWLCIAVFTSGCAHHQLRYQTVKQAHTVADIHTQQVLDNLAKFAHNSNSMPHFSFPNAGASQVNGNVNGNVAFDFMPSSLMDWGFGFAGSRGMVSSYTMTPINDPRKLELMRCAYQRSVGCCCYSGESGHCPNCQKRFNKFYLGSESIAKVAAATPDGHAIYRLYESRKQNGGFRLVFADRDEENKKIYRDLETGHEVPNVVEKHLTNVYVDETVAERTRRRGTITADCLRSPCWFNAGTAKDLPKKLHAKCTYVGHYCGTVVWVEPDGIDQLTQLTMTILDIALNDPPSTRNKEVIAYLDEGNHVVRRDQATYEVRATIPFGSNVKTVVPNVPKSTLKRQVELKVLSEVAADKRFCEVLEKMKVEKKNALPLDGTKQLQETPEGRLQIARSIVELRKSQKSFAKLDQTTQEEVDSSIELLRAKLETTLELEALRTQPQLEAERQQLRRLPPVPTPIPNAGYLQFDQNFRALSP